MQQTFADGLICAFSYHSSVIKKNVVSNSQHKNFPDFDTFLTTFRKIIAQKQEGSESQAKNVTIVNRE